MNTSRQRSTENTSADSLNDYAIDSHDPNQGELFGSSVAENTAHARRDPTITHSFSEWQSMKERLYKLHGISDTQ